MYSNLDENASKEKKKAALDEIIMEHANTPIKQISTVTISSIVAEEPQVANEELRDDMGDVNSMAAGSRDNSVIPPKQSIESSDGNTSLSVQPSSIARCIGGCFQYL